MGEEVSAEDDAIPVYAVRLTSAAAEQTRAAFFWINDNAGINAADEWQSGINGVWAS